MLSKRATRLRLRPLKQGEFDGLCGLYAGVNAVRLLLAVDRPLSSADQKTLFRAGVQMLVKRERLASAVLTGIPGGTLRRLLRKLTARAADLSGRHIVLTHPFRDHARVARCDLLGSIDAAIDQGQPVIASLSGKHDHYTVICGRTPSRYNLFDSGALYWLSRDLCGPSPGRRDWEHKIDIATLTLLSFGPGQ